uniref:RING-type domain-containing protein n=1 Tax=Heterorhabditis bacteriophora TaxID=37862 RepID=A0A1I7WTJ6_HETBA
MHLHIYIYIYIYITRIWKTKNKNVVRFTHAMNSTIVDSGSMVSTSTRLHRNANMTGHLRPRDFYLWLFGQMHVKICLYHSCRCSSLSLPITKRNFQHVIFLYLKCLSKAIRFTFIPMIIIWIAFLYLLYGCVLGFVYVWRRANGWRSRKDAAAASFSWSFKGMIFCHFCRGIIFEFLKFKCCIPTITHIIYNSCCFSRPPCLWLHWIALRLPKWFITEFPSGTCTFLLFFVLISSVLMICAIYLREREMYGISAIRRTLKITMIIPSIVTEVHSRILSGMITHMATILYICKSEKCSTKPVSLRDYTCGQPTPTQSLLEILKHPSMVTRPSNTQFSAPAMAAGDCTSVNNNELPQKADTPSANSTCTIISKTNTQTSINKWLISIIHCRLRFSDTTADFVGYDRLRRAMMRGNTVIEDNSTHRVVPLTRLDISTSSNSDYSQIRNYDQAYTMTRNIRHGSGVNITPRIPPTYMDSTYLEVV